MVSPSDPIVPSPDNETPNQEKLKTLRRIIVGPAADRLHRLEHRLDDFATRTKEVSHILPDAIALSLDQDRRIAGALRATIEDSIRDSVRKDPKVLADAIFPLMGPGIRRAIATAIMGMIQSFNQLLNHSFSIQGLKWRFEALRTHRPYAEIVLFHTLVYQVEQIFLIHCASGLVLHHVSGGTADYQDPDMVSGMLTAIEDFVRDSFGGTSEEGLDTLRIGNQRTIWIEKGPKAYMAAVIRGTPPLELRQRMNETLGSIHIRFQQPLEQYQGDSAAFENADEVLATCLDARFKETTKKTSPLLWVMAAILIGIVAWGAVAAFQYKRRCNHFLAALKHQPGIVVTDVEKKGRHLMVLGLKDPLAEDPTPLPRSFGFSDDQVDFHLQPYVSLEPSFILKRARQILGPPPSVQLAMQSGALVVSGVAGHQWIQRLMTTFSAIPGVFGIHTQKLVDSDIEALGTLDRHLQQLRILFPVRSATMDQGQDGVLTRLMDDLGLLEQLSQRLGRALGIRILGYSDSAGTEAVRLAISQQRAEAVYRYILRKSDLDIDIKRVGLGMYPQVEPVAPTEKVQALSRCVVFELLNHRLLR
ncbi:putative outer membrane protein, OmpA/MotB domain [Desulfosarcina variabilis str. Montpellier]